MVKKNIIFLEKNMVSLIRHKGDKIEFIKKDGETDKVEQLVEEVKKPALPESKECELDLYFLGISAWNRKCTYQNVPETVGEHACSPSVGFYFSVCKYNMDLF